LRPLERSAEQSLKAEKPKTNAKLHKPHLVQETAEKLREVILEREPGAQIGSLNTVAQLLGVGIVTVQQVARILEHEGLLEVRRGPGGGYYGTRPDEAALERSVAAYMRVHGFGYREALEMTTLLDCDIIPAAALCQDETVRADLRALLASIDTCTTRDTRAAFELELRDALFKVVARPLMELLLRVTTTFYEVKSHPPLFSGEAGVLAWMTGRRRILQAILSEDEELARFEAERFRQLVASSLRQQELAPQ
jgi:DNA-binding FadR family transcriptional regulator